MAPFAAGAIRPIQNPPARDNARASPSADDHRENRRVASTGAIGGFAHRQAICVIADAHRAPQAGFQILLQRTAIQSLGIGIADQARNWAQAARNADANAAALPKPRFGFRHQASDGRQNALIFRGARAAFAQQHGAIIAKGHDFRLGAAQINAEFHAISLGQGRAAPQA